MQPRTNAPDPIVRPTARGLESECCQRDLSRINQKTNEKFLADMGNGIPRSKSLADMREAKSALTAGVEGAASNGVRNRTTL